MTKKEGAMNAPTPKPIGVLSSPPTSPDSSHFDKVNDNQGDKQYHPCTYCPSFCRCMGYYQWLECKKQLAEKNK